MLRVLEAALYLKKAQDVLSIVKQHIQMKALVNGLYLRSFSSRDMLHKEVDLVSCLGTDGLILHMLGYFET